MIGVVVVIGAAGTGVDGFTERGERGIPAAGLDLGPREARGGVGLRRKVDVGREGQASEVHAQHRQPLGLVRRRHLWQRWGSNDARK